MPEPIPVDEFVALLNSHWNASNVTKPVLTQRNSGSEARIDLNRGDYCIGVPGTPTLDEIPLGNWNSVTRNYSIGVELSTRVSRQRLYDLMAEVRRICHAKRHDMSNFQRVQFVSFNESVDDSLNIWQDTCDISLTNESVTAET